MVEVFEAAEAREPAEREAIIREGCGDDLDVRSQVESMLAEVDRPMVIDRPLGEAITGILDDDDSAVAVGAQLGPYRVESLLGAGGMGEVYRAADTVLGRQVAIKLLPADVSSDPERIARLRREARVLAALNHVNIGAIYGLEAFNGKAGPTFGLVLELVDGRTLAERLVAGRLPVAEALDVARQIAGALEAAHLQGIVHRDLKPGNIKVREDGTVKVLDFGLARLAEAGAEDAVPADSPAESALPSIVTPAMSATGMILGTAAYMSPEQAKRKPADKRSDIWAFGCVLYEMLSGTRAFAGDDAAEVLEAVVTKEPDWTRLPSEVPPTVATYLRRCLHKDPRERVADAQDIRLALQGAFDDTSPTPDAVRTVLPWRRVAVLGGAVLLGAAAAGAGLKWFTPRQAPPRVSRFEAAPAPAAAPAVNGSMRDVAITADGSRIVYVSSDNTHLFVRALDALQPVTVFTGTPNGPFVSPDGRWIGFVDGTSVLKKVPVAGGAAITLATLDGAFFGATWGPDDSIIVATNNPVTGLQRVSAAGGAPTVLTRPDATINEPDHLWPELLPGGDVLLFTVGGLPGRATPYVAAMDLRSGTRKVLIRGGSDAHYVASGHLLYAAGGTWWGVGFDPSRLETYGTPVPLISDVVMTRTGAIDARVARDGTLVYLSGGRANLAAPRTLVWVDRQGRETAIPAPPRPYIFVDLSPDDSRIATFAGDQELDIWLFELSRATLRQVTFDPTLDSFPTWSPDGRRLFFTSARNGASNIYSQATDGTGTIERISDSPNMQSPTDVLGDGSGLIFTERDQRTQRGRHADDAR